MILFFLRIVVPGILFSTLVIDVSQAVDGEEPVKKPLKREDILLLPKFLEDGSGIFCVYDEEFSELPLRNVALFAHTARGSYVPEHSFKNGGDLSRCRPGQAVAGVYRPVEDGFVRIWSGGGDPSSLSHLDAMDYSNGEESFAIVIYDSNGGGNSGDIYRQAYVYDNDGLNEIDNGVIDEFGKDEIEKGQFLRNNWAEYRDGDITYSANIFSRDDYYGDRRVGSLAADLRLERRGDGFALVVTKSRNVGKARYYNDQGLAAYRAGKYDKAVELFRHGVEEDDRAWETWTNLGLALLQQQKYAESIEASTEVLAHAAAGNNARGNAAYNIGRAHELRGFPEHAEPYYLQALELVPSDARREALSRIRAQIEVSNSK